ncbi:DUF4192 family protein [Propionicimonas sp.]|uniref:DUF4192 family protein n=1 Tax=Propionicimonas sp. TaxID=1955623 RepID=UPI0017C699A0|nr:DUF4192 family protein [Propionicimonas sp.]MBA3019690.1 DUF4192 family protein [Propionicimonas sp.]MBU4207965.1 DUF4192 domain-containing protein [Actinomycetota bacterium]MBU4411492.1 DUF4192 domain-containing protein [Actinomycetota bacterium]MCG2805808.1 DUF4192 domain-containing protein [Propionicimonas sp.]
MTQVISIHTVTDILGIIPPLLGFVPDDCVVVVATREGRMVVAARLGLEETTVQMDLAGQVTAAARQVHADSAFIVGYHTSPNSNAIPLVNLLLDALPTFGITPHAPIYVTGDQNGDAVYHCMCTDPGCDAIGKVPPPTRIEGILEAAVSRQAIVERVAAGPRSAAVGEAMAHLSGRMTAEEAEAAVQSVLGCDSVDHLTNDQVALAAHALRVSHHQVRAAIGLPMTAKEADFGGVQQRLADDPSRVDRLIEMAACLPDNRATACLEVLAANAYWCGNGTLANIALKRIGSRRLSWVGDLIDKAIEEGTSPANYRP